MSIKDRLKKIREGEAPDPEPEREDAGPAGLPDWLDEGDEDETVKHTDQIDKNTNSPSGRPLVLEIDSGLFPCVGEALAPYADVNYFSDWANGSPTPDRHYIGYGLPGITRIDSAINCLNGLDDRRRKTRKPDLVVIPDVGMGDLAHDIVQRHGIPVFGTFFGEDLEDDRIKFREKLNELGMPYAPYVAFTNDPEKQKYKSPTAVKPAGMDSLREYLKTVKDKWVKLSLYRGNGETFYHEDYESSKVEINRLAHQLGVLDVFTEFIVEDAIEDATEIGAEWMMTVPGFLPRGLYGYEIKNKGYSGVVSEYDALPEAIKSVMDKFLPVYQKYGIRGQLSVEMRVNKKGPHFIDPCQRFASPGGESVALGIKNLYAVMKSVADGKTATPDFRAKHFAQVMLHVDESSNEPMQVDYPEKFSRNIALRNPCVVNRRRYFFPLNGETIAGTAVGWGKDQDEAREMAMEAAKAVDADVHYALNVFDKADEAIEKGRKLGIHF